uniref:Gem nuclear organelle associated protein 2 n=1 Tax=Ursus americanus TaxID=9643 RepID=A0A452S7P5_URSAM
MNLFCLPVSRCVLLDFLAFNPVNFGNILFTTSIAILNVFSDFVKNRRNVPLVLLHMNKAQPYSHFFNLLLICRIEAAQCPDVVVAQIDPKKLKRKQSVNVSLSGCQPAPEGYSPTLQWQQQQVAQFSSVRQSVIRHRNHWKSQQLDSNVTMPKSEDEEGWKKFCLGERLCAEGAVGPATNEGPGIDYVQIGFPPLLSIVSRMNQATVTSVLEYLSNWFGERDFTPELVVLHLFIFIILTKLYILILYMRYEYMCIIPVCITVYNANCACLQ